MLNGQLFYGTPLKIVFDKNPADSIILPKGLAHIGQGLGIKARPIRNIAQQYQRYARKQPSSINPILFSEIDFSGEYVNNVKEENPEEIEKKIKEVLNSRPGCNILNPTVRFKNIDQLECPDGSMDATDLSTTETSTVSKKPGGDTKINTGPLHPLHPTRNLLSSQFSQLAGPRVPVFSSSNNLQGPLPFRPRVPCIPPAIQRPPLRQPRPPFPPPVSVGPLRIMLRNVSTYLDSIIIFHQIIRHLTKKTN